MSFVQRGRSGEGGASVGGGGPSEVCAADIPALVEYLTLDHYEDGASRETATLLIFAEEGRFKGCLNDRQEERVCWVSSGSLLGLIAELEANLEAGTADWRRSWKSKKK